MNHCPGCGCSFTQQTPGHPIDTLPGMEIVPYCDRCHSRLTLGAKKSYITKIFNGWRKGNDLPEYETAWAIALDTADYEHNQNQRRSK